MLLTAFDGRDMFRIQDWRSGQTNPPGSQFVTEPRTTGGRDVTSVLAGPVRAMARRGHDAYGTKRRFAAMRWYAGYSGQHPTSDGAVGSMGRQRLIMAL